MKEYPTPRAHARGSCAECWIMAACLDLCVIARAYALICIYVHTVGSVRADNHTLATARLAQVVSVEQSTVSPTYYDYAYDEECVLL